MGVLSISSFPLNKPLQRMQDSPLRGLTSWLLLACSPPQEARLRSNSNKPDLSRNNLLPHQHLRLRDTRVTPMPEQTLLLGVNLNTKHLLEHPNNLAITPAATPAVLPTSPNSSRRSPTACSTSPRSPPGPPSPSSILSAPSSSSCPACTSCMFEASPWEILLAGV